MTDSVKEFLQELSQQTPEKPDYWSSCGQCQRNANRAEDLLETLDAAAPAQSGEPVAWVWCDVIHEEHCCLSDEEAIENGWLPLIYGALSKATETVEMHAGLVLPKAGEGPTIIANEPPAQTERALTPDDVIQWLEKEGIALSSSFNDDTYGPLFDAATKLRELFTDAAQPASGGDHDA